MQLTDSMWAATRRYAGDSSGSLAMAVAFSDNAYYTQHYEAVGQPYLTDIHPNTAQRAPGVVQSILAHEAVMEHVAQTLGLPMDAVQVRRMKRLHICCVVSSCTTCAAPCLALVGNSHGDVMAILSPFGRYNNYLCLSKS